MEIDALINCYKPSGITSYQFIQQIKEILNVKKIGHAGTLDPLAEGVLIVLLNKATKWFSWFSSLDKEYEVTIELGKETDTWDSEGQLLFSYRVPHLSPSQISHVLSLFVGNFYQLIPPFSASKFKGKPRYFYARKGKKIPDKKEKTKIYQLKLLKYEPPFVTLRINCGSGTYVRSIAYDLGKRLKTGAIVIKIIRLSVGPFRIEKSLPLESIKRGNIHFYSQKEVENLIKQYKY